MARELTPGSPAPSLVAWWRDQRKRMRRMAPRQLRPTREGRWLLGITVAAGFAALNTGNNLLFFGWGLLLASVLISGLLSEATLRVVRAELLRVDELRAGEQLPLPVALENRAPRLPAFGVEVRALIDDGSPEEREAPARYQLRLEPHSREELRAYYLPTRRGVHKLTALRVATRYPFGFFEKSRLFTERVLPDLVVFPRRVDTGELPHRLLARIGAMPTRRAGPGDEFFALRPYKDGDDPRRVHWRRSARSGRWVVRETESEASRQVILVLALASGAAVGEVEEAIAWTGSLAEDLLEAGHAVGLSAPGSALAPAPGGRQRLAILSALARADPREAVPPIAAGAQVARVVVATPGAARPSGAAWVHEVGVAP